MNTFIYLVKFIASLFVISLHAEFPGTFGLCFNAAARFAVPFFFAVSGRYLIPSNVRSASDIRKRVSGSLKKIIKVTLIVYFVYLLYSVFYHLVIANVKPEEWLTSKFNLNEAKVFFLFNTGKCIFDGSVIYDHLWYLFAIIYVYVIIIIFAKVLRKWYKGLVIGLLGLLFFGELLQTYYPVKVFDISIKTWYVFRNWLFMGIPFVLMGIWFSDYIADLKDKLSREEYRIKTGKWVLPSVIAIICGTICSIVEFLIFDEKECPLGALFVVLGLLFLSETGISGGKYLWKIGKEASPNIYFYHVLLMSVVDQILFHLGSDGIPVVIRPVVIMVLSVITMYFIPNTIKKRLRHE